MQRSTITTELQKYIAHDVLDGKDIGLDETTPLLEWGIVNSFEMTKLLGFIRQQFDVEITPSQLVADSFADIHSITDLVMENIASRS